MKTKSMKEIAILSLKYTVSNKKAILILGILIIFKELLQLFVTNYKNFFIIPILILMIFLYLYYVGFLVYFVEEVISDPKNPPKSNYKKIFRKGLHEVIFYTFYILIIGFTHGFLSYFGKAYPNFAEMINTLNILLISFLGLLPMAAVVNVFLHDEKIKHGFKIKEIVNLILNLKTSKFIWIIILSLISENFVLTNFRLVNNVVSINFIHLILNILIIPVIIIFIQFVKTIVLLTDNY